MSTGCIQDCCQTDSTQRCTLTQEPPLVPSTELCFFCFNLTCWCTGCCMACWTCDVNNRGRLPLPPPGSIVRPKPGLCRQSSRQQSQAGTHSEEFLLVSLVLAWEAERSQLLAILADARAVASCQPAGDAIICSAATASGVQRAWHAAHLLEKLLCLAGSYQQQILEVST